PARRPGHHGCDRDALGLLRDADDPHGRELQRGPGEPPRAARPRRAAQRGHPGADPDRPLAPSRKHATDVLPGPPCPMNRHTLTPDLAARLASISLGHVTREYPNKLDHVMTGPLDVMGPRALHPIFYGSFDWHSCVHGYWTLSRLYRLAPSMQPAAAVRALFD